MTQYYQRWHTLSHLPQATFWTSQGLLPHDLTDNDRLKAQLEIESLPEQFYTSFDWLPVITPELYTYFEKTVPVPHQIALWTIFSGSSRLNTHMSQIPFLQAVLFPVDLRYGWNLRNSHHQQLLQRANKLYKPFTTTVELRNHPWKYTSKDDSETLEVRKLELPMLQFVAQHAIHLANTNKR